MAPENCNEGIDSKGLEEGKGRICSKDNNDSDLTGLDVADVDAAVVVVNGKIRPARGQLSSVFSFFYLGLVRNFKVASPGRDSSRISYKTSMQIEGTRFSRIVDLELAR
jgi:hypothetical protein